MFLKSLLVFVGSAVVAAAAGAAAPVRDLDSRLGIYEGTGGTSCSHLIMDVLPWWRWRKRPFRTIQTFSPSREFTV